MELPSKEPAVEIRKQDMNGPGLVQVYTGDGKGKTTAALGLALRASGHRYSVTVIQFAKGISYTGELFSIQRLYPEIRLYQFGRDCRRASSVRQGIKTCSACCECMLKVGEVTDEDRSLAEKALALAFDVASGDDTDILILDEVSLAIKFGLIATYDVVRLIKGKPKNMELILTGRDMPKEILECADLVTEMREVKHPYAQGIPARRGIEY
ncbi:MAG: cob(I)yrinic acid a,c-diamide adenosyltransferase [Bacillota bacterium]|jgi:cob(I)alamin adenosyltransferase